MLHFDLKVNDQLIGRVRIVRQNAEIPEDRICTYQVEIWQYPTAIAGTHYREFTLRHKYDEGAFELVRKALVHYWVEDLLEDMDLDEREQQDRLLREARGDIQP